jgi:hypothetical protein
MLKRKQRGWLAYTLDLQTQTIATHIPFQYVVIHIIVTVF